VRHRTAVAARDETPTPAVLQGRSSKGAMNDTATVTVDAYTVGPNTANNTAARSVQVRERDLDCAAQAAPGSRTSTAMDPTRDPRRFHTS
jgi:hypothetical protein